MNGDGADDGGQAVASSSIPPPLDWKFSQVFGERMVGEEVQEGKSLRGKASAGKFLRGKASGGKSKRESWHEEVLAGEKTGGKTKGKPKRESWHGKSLWVRRPEARQKESLRGSLGMRKSLRVRRPEARQKGSPRGSLGMESPRGSRSELLARESPYEVRQMKIKKVDDQSLDQVRKELVDIIAAIEFDKSGDHLATGDRGGRVVLFERTDAKNHGSRKDLEGQDYPFSRHAEFRYKTEFQSHEPEFDYLKSLEIEEKINKVRWCQTANGALFLLSTNDKTIKYWKVQEKKVKQVSEMNLDASMVVGNGCTDTSTTRNVRPSFPNGCSRSTFNYRNTDLSFPPGGFPSLRLPVVVTSQEKSLVARCRRVYAHAHDYHINSISNNSDGETFISADDLRINLWNLEISSQSFNIVDVKPTNMEDLTEVITSAEFHPIQCNMLVYSSSKGSIRLIDLRQSALCDNHSKLFENHEAPASRSFFTEIIASISDVKFAKDGRHILSRDYMTLKLWDINMDSAPVATFQVHEYLRPKLCDLYENDSIFDKFECCLSGDGFRVATGSYSNLFRVFGCVPGSDEATILEASKNPMRKQVQSPTRTSRSLGSFTLGARRGAENPNVDANGNTFDSTIKLLHLAWHPTENLVACAAANSLYMYYA